VHRLQFHYTLSQHSSPALVRNPLIDLLQAVSQQGSISGGARALNLSYRHVWGELKRWELELGNDLLVWEKGQSARLTEFGAKLMWAERQAQARLARKSRHWRSELERAFAVAFDAQAHVVTLYASHDHALAALREQALGGASVTKSSPAVAPRHPVLRQRRRHPRAQRRTVRHGRVSHPANPGTRLAGGEGVQTAAQTGPAQNHRLCRDARRA